MKTRRSFISTSLKAGAIIPFLGLPLSSCENLFAKKKLNILILGGTSFLGPHQIAYALEKGHNISIFTRGKTKPSVHKELFKKVEHLVGDRENNLEELKNRKWDAVIDNSGRNEKWTRDTAKLLKDNVELYLYTSSTGVYFPYLGNNISEKTKVLLNVPENIEEFERLEYDYGVMKATSELAVKEYFGEERTIAVRPTYMIGPGDKTDRFIHWPIRLSKGGEILVPGKKNDPVQFVDVRDVAEFMIRLIESKTAITVNAVGPKDKMGMHNFITEASKTFDTNASFVEIEDYNFLKQQKVYYIIPWIISEGNSTGSALINNNLAISNGFTFRPLQKSIKEIYDWWYSDALTEERRKKYEENPNGILAREKEIIKAWKNHIATSNKI